MNLQDLIDFHTVGAEACEAYAVTPGAAEDKNKDIGKHYNKRAKWHRDAIALVQGLLGQGEPVALLSKGFTTLESEGGKYRIITAYQNRDDAWSDYRALCKAEQPAPVAVAHTMRSVMEAYEAAKKNHLTGTSNFCAAMAARLNGVKP